MSAKSAPAQAVLSAIVECCPYLQPGGGSASDLGAHKPPGGKHQQPVRHCAWPAPLANALALVSEMNDWRKAQRQIRARPALAAASLADGGSPESTGAISVSHDVARVPVIVLGLYWLDYGGAEKFAIDCVEAAAQEHVCVVLTDQRSSHPFRSRIDGPNVLVFHLDQDLPTERHDDFLATLLSQLDVRLVHIHHCVWLYNRVDTIKRLSPSTWVMDTLHLVEHDQEGFPRLAGERSAWIDEHHVISHHLRSYLETRFGVRDKVAVAKLIDTKRVPPVQPNWRGVGALVRVVFVGRMERQKRPRLFVLMARRLKANLAREGLACEFVMVGAGALLDKTRRLASVNSDLGVSFLPPDTCVPELLAQAHVLILPSENEGIPLVAYEAIRHGCLPVCTAVGGNVELCGDLVVPVAPQQTVFHGVRRVQSLVLDADFRARAWQQLRQAYLHDAQQTTGIQHVTARYHQVMAKDRATIVAHDGGRGP